MQIIDNLIILVLIGGAFFCGLRLSDWYWRKIINETRYACKILAADKGLGYVTEPQETNPIGQDFMNRLRETGRATQAIRTPRT